MCKITLVLAATALSLAVAGPALAGCRAAQVVHVGLSSNDPEKGTVGLMCEPAEVERTGSVAGTLRRELQQVGSSTGEAEKDTLGFVHAAAAQ